MQNSREKCGIFCGKTPRKWGFKYAKLRLPQFLPQGIKKSRKPLILLDLREQGTRESNITSDTSKPL